MLLALLGAAVSLVEHKDTRSLVDVAGRERKEAESQFEIIAGCCPTVNNEYCGFWAPNLTRALFPARRVRVVKMKCLDTTEYEDEEVKLQRCKPYVVDTSLPTPDILYCSADQLSDEHKKKMEQAPQIVGQKRPVSPHHPFIDGVMYPINGKVKSHASKRPFLVYMEYEFGKCLIRGEADVTLSGWNNGAQRHVMANEGKASPVLYIPQSFTSFGFRHINEPSDIFQIQRQQRDSKITNVPLLSTVAERLGRRVELKKTEFMGFIQGKCYFQNYNIDALLRVAFFDEVAATYPKKPTALGLCRYGAGGAQSEHERSQGKHAKERQLIKSKMEEYGESNADRAIGQDRAVLKLESFKFAIAMHNQHDEGGVQEKLVHPWLAHTVPIYWGDPISVKQLFNPDAFINCEVHGLEAKLAELRAFKSRLKDLPVIDELGTHAVVNKLLEETRHVFRPDFQRCIQLVKAVDEDDEKWQAMVRAPVSASKVLKGSAFDMDVYANRVRAVLQNANSYLLR